MVARYTRALSGELAVEEFQRSWDFSLGNDFAYLCRQFHNLETHRQRDTAFNGENPTPSA